MEIEKKYTIKELPDLSKYNYHKIEQAYLNTEPVIRIRRQDNDFYLTYKGKGLLVREEYNLFLNEASFYHLLEKADGRIIKKTRYLIPYKNNTIELDVFDDTLKPLIIAEIEFDTKEAALAFIPPAWFDKDVTLNPEYQNSNLSKLNKKQTSANP